MVWRKKLILAKRSFVSQVAHFRDKALCSTGSRNGIASTYGWSIYSPAELKGAPSAMDKDDANLSDHRAPDPSGQQPSHPKKLERAKLLARIHSGKRSFRLGSLSHACLQWSRRAMAGRLQRALPKTDGSCRPGGHQDAAECGRTRGTKEQGDGDWRTPWDFLGTSEVGKRICADGFEISGRVPDFLVSLILVSMHTRCWKRSSSSTGRQQTLRHSQHGLRSWNHVDLSG